MIRFSTTKALPPIPALTRVQARLLPKMNIKTDARAGADDDSPSQTPGEKPRFAIFVATAGGLGYFPKAPGTLGSLAGIALAIAPFWFVALKEICCATSHPADSVFFHVDPVFVVQLALAVMIALTGVWSASRAAKFWHIKDPQRVVIDEVSGQHLTLMLGCGVPLWWKAFTLSSVDNALGYISLSSPFNWKYLLVGFLLFRLFDIWKPFPARQAEALPGGWGIMTDDWVAGIYAGIGLWLARAAGL
jgi:phosphatidylglycerophosphatase A